MFGSKKQTAKTPWTVESLTTEYLVSGSVREEDYKTGGDDLFAMACLGDLSDSGIDAFQQLRLANAHIQPTGNLVTLEQSFSEWEMPMLDLVVAIIPRDQVCLQAAQKAFKDYRHPMEVVLYAGPYAIRAKLMSDDADQSRSPFMMTQVLPLTDAIIDCQLPGAKLKGFAVPWLLLNGGGLLHGIGFV
ncbi:hypothetical protein ANRL3_01360 [Anaerolineae bacterium]|nr:hypothetical protein ANRL3_01360 [Anaerolineae bacterium]